MIHITLTITLLLDSLPERLTSEMYINIPNTGTGGYCEIFMKHKNGMKNKLKDRERSPCSEVGQKQAED